MAAVFPLVPRRRVIGLAFGGVRSARRGIGSDVASTRPYQPGDDLAWMDWAASAKLSAARGEDEFIVRERFADPRNDGPSSYARFLGSGLGEDAVARLRNEAVEAVRIAMEAVDGARGTA